MQRRISATLVLAAGVVLVTTTFADRLWSRASAFERISDNFRPLMTEETFDTLRGDIASLEAAVAEFQAKAVPTLAPAFGLSPAQFSQLLTTQFPTVAAGVQAVPQITPQFSALINAFDAERARFASADEIPTRTLPATTVPWAILGPGIILILAGLAMYGRSWTAPVVAAVIGVALVAVTLGLSEPRKASDYDALNDNLRAVYTAQTVAGARQGYETITAMAADLQGKLLPAVAQRIGVPPDQVIATLGSQFPALTGGLGNLVAAQVRFDAVVGGLEANLADTELVRPLAFAPVVWTLVGAGAAVIFGAGWSLTLARAAEIGVHPSRRALRREKRARRAA